MNRECLILCLVSGTVLLFVVVVVIGSRLRQKRHDERTTELLASTPWISTDGSSLTMRFTKEKCNYRYFAGVGRAPARPVEYAYTVQGDVITLHGEPPIKLRIQKITRNNLFLI